MATKSAVLFGFLWFGLVLLKAQPFGLGQRVAVGPFLNGAFPQQEPVASAWQAVEAFPQLTFDDPTCIVSEPRSNRMYVCARQGAIYFFVNEMATPTKTLFLDLTQQTQGYDGTGLLGLAFHPEYGLEGSPNRGYVYVYYTYSSAPVADPREGTPGYDRLARFTVPDGSLAADPNSELVLLNQYDPHTWHNGGGMFFGPEGFLYFSNGDVGGDNDPYRQAQRIDAGLFAGVFRIDVEMDPTRSHPIRRQPVTLREPPDGWPGSSSQHYFIPNDNPWLDTGGAVLEEYYALGFRSPHRMTHDGPTGRIWLGDVGQNSREEVDLVEKGGNYQWSYQEGVQAGPTTKPGPLLGTDRPPLYDYSHNTGDNCVIGGYVYRGSELAAFLSGRYIFGDNISGRIWAMDYDGSAAPVVTYLCTVPNGGTEFTGLSSFGMDRQGELYMCVMGLGTKLYKLAPAGVSAAPPALLSQTGAFSDLATLSPSAALVPYEVNAPLWSDHAVKSRWMVVPNDGMPYGADETIGFAASGSWEWPTGTVLVKHFELPVDEANPTLRKRLETRFLVKDTKGAFYGLTYKWREDNSDADLLAGNLNESIPVTTSTGVRTQVWYYPNRQDCIRCHNANANQVLGVRTCHLNGAMTYPASGLTDNQLRTLNHIGMFRTPIEETSIASYPRSAGITDSSATPEHRVRSYLDANCAHCHRPNGVQAAFFDARYDTPLAAQGILSGPVSNALGIEKARVVSPGHLDQSILYLRDSVVGLNQMPPLAKNVVDVHYLQVLGQWITSLQPVALTSIAVTPGTVSVSVGTPVQFSAVGTWSDGSTENITS